MRALLYLLETITIRIRSHEPNKERLQLPPPSTEVEMPGPSHQYAMKLRVLYTNRPHPVAAVRQKLREAFSASRASP